MNGRIPFSGERDAQGAPFDPSLLSQALFSVYANTKRKDQRPWGNLVKPDKTRQRMIPNEEPAAKPQEARASCGTLALATQQRVSVFSFLSPAWTASRKASRECGEWDRIATEGYANPNGLQNWMWKRVRKDACETVEKRLFASSTAIGPKIRRMEGWTEAENLIKPLGELWCLHVPDLRGEWMAIYLPHVF
ncbi:hypothetical protein MFUM_260012 [Methylacidiphilum fumariolicum SolV]|uniref:Uncharacterized protein n=1 Tax=Methylacidiphilum fumariolicum (strain SolV) TaxID=1156937 RepID=I0JXB3_METFB|nr:hypothetical protein [Candidatus Methylacidiphilum fumarolicum]TFE76789.1 hypothetical protein A7D33_08355 [Candidatus Methylacidiphilum fumarolicum]CCG91882.1 hypothetical protein MFUM_260012 [Methylacidiphilum fumariolicum SolV]